MQIGGLMGFVLLLLVISYIIIHRDAKNIKRYKRKTTDLIEQLEQSVQQNEVLITSRKKAVHTITHELRTPLTAITGYTELLRKECNSGNNGQYIRNILQSSDRMRICSTLCLTSSAWTTARNSPVCHPAGFLQSRTHLKRSSFLLREQRVVLVREDWTRCHCIDRQERIIQIGNNLLSNAASSQKKAVFL